MEGVIVVLLAILLAICIFAVNFVRKDASQDERYKLVFGTYFVCLLIGGATLLLFELLSLFLK